MVLQVEVSSQILNLSHCWLAVQLSAIDYVALSSIWSYTYIKTDGSIVKNVRH